MDVLRTLLDHVGHSITLWWAALRLDPDVTSVLAPGASWVPVILIALVAAVATLLGQSVVLFVNRIRRWQLVFSLLFVVLGVLGSHLMEGVLLWGLSHLVLDDPFTVLEVTKVVILSSAPFAFAFLTAIPLLGPGLNRLLSIWSLLVLWAVVAATFEAGPWAAAGLVLVSWVGKLVLGNLSGPVLAGLRDRLWRRMTGRPLHMDTNFLLELGARPQPHENGPRA